MSSQWVHKLKYFFTITPTVQTVPVGEVPTGYRVDLRYISGKATTDDTQYKSDWLGGAIPAAVARALGPNATALQNLLSGTYQDIRTRRDPTVGAPSYAQVKTNEQELLDLRQNLLLEWFGIEGSILSGSDWVTIRQDGVAVFDGRATIKTTDGALIDAVISGAVDLRNRQSQPLQPPTSDPRSPAYDDWLRGALAQPIPAVLAVRFEAASATKSWAANTIQAASAGFWKYERLVRGQFVAVGRVDTEKTNYSPISSVIVDIYEVQSVLQVATAAAPATATAAPAANRNDGRRGGTP
jgi:Protein of unknown function (DUF3237)